MLLFNYNCQRILIIQFEQYCTLNEIGKGKTTHLIMYAVCANYLQSFNLLYLVAHNGRGRGVLN